jgi:hypothetical protein
VKGRRKGRRGIRRWRKRGVRSLVVFIAICCMYGKGSESAG